MDFIAKLKETLSSVLPIVIFVSILNFTIAPIGEIYFSFLIGSVFLIIGLSIFLTGADIGMVPVGEKLGSALAHKQSLVLMLAVGFVIGFGVTFAEPDVNVLANQVHSLNPSINERLLSFSIAIGLGVLVDIGLLRVVRKIPLKIVLVVFYIAVFLIMAFCGQSMASISFDASGATTGPLAVPFLLSLGLGVSAASKDGEGDSFGLTGVASIGPILAVGLMAILSGKNSAVLEDIDEVAHSSLSLGFILISMVRKTAVGFGPLAAIILILQFTLLHFPHVRFRRICLGIVYAFVGIVLFLAGVEYGFTNVGTILGQSISAKYPGWIVVAVAVIFGAIVVSAEPAVWVLTQQVETVSAGRINKKLVLSFLCVGVASAVGLAIVRILNGINYLWFIYIEIGIALILTFFCPQLFVGIAFDSGGVASGPMSTTFLLSFAMGVSGSADMGFGLVGLIAMSPLIAIQILGIILKIKEMKIMEAENAGA